MDYNHDICSVESQCTLGNICHKIFTFLFTILAIAGTLSLVYVVYNLHYDLQQLKDEMSAATNDTKKDLLNDPVGRPDFALESIGGRVLSVDAATYTESDKTFFGFRLCEGPHGPSAMIHPTGAPGECWAFKGHAGSATIKLMTYILIDAVTLEHIPKSLSPSGSTDTAPKDFKVWGMDDTNGRNRRLLGQFKYEKEGDSVQTFPIVDNTYCYQFVEFQVLSNHGNDQFTCVYRIRVHGTMSKIG